MDIFTVDITRQLHPDKLEFVTLLYTDTHLEFEYTHEYAHR